MNASVHLGPNYSENFGSFQEHELRRAMFDITQRLILEHEAEMLNVSPIGWTAPSWTRSVLTHDQLIKWTKPTVHVYSDSVSCLGKMQEHSEANRGWNDQLEEFRQSSKAQTRLLRFVSVTFCCAQSGRRV